LCVFVQIYINCGYLLTCYFCAWKPEQGENRIFLSLGPRFPISEQNKKSPEACWERVSANHKNPPCAVTLVLALPQGWVGVGLCLTAEVLVREFLVLATVQKRR
jgi:hypothetical protein